MTREEVKQEFITKQPSINECESCPNKGIRLWKCAELHGCKWAQAMMEIAKMLESEPCEDCISRQAVLEVQIKYAEHMGATKYWQMRDDIRALPSVEPETKYEELLLKISQLEEENKKLKQEVRTLYDEAAEAHELGVEQI